MIFLYEFNNRTETIKAWETLLSYNPEAKAPNSVPVRDMVAQLKIGMPFMQTPGK